MSHGFGLPKMACSNLINTGAGRFVTEERGQPAAPAFTITTALAWIPTLVL